MTASFEERDVRIAKLESIKNLNFNPYPRADFKPDTFAISLLDKFKNMDSDEITKNSLTYRLCGRIMLIRDFGKGGFIGFKDTSSKFQAFISKKDINDAEFNLYKNLDIGDFIGVEGTCFKTKTGDLSIHTKKLLLLSKAIRPLPEKFHGLTDIEARYRQRYLDLIMNEESKNIFVKRSKIITFLRDYLIKKDFLEVETPMMHPLAGGANAKPFNTHHNALNMDLFMRVAPELYLKRLVVGGLERVFEINRNFRNEGLSIFHNPEFTMMELYIAYATFEDLIELVEDSICHIATKLNDSDSFTYQDNLISLKRPWARLSVQESLIKHCKCLNFETVNSKEALFNYTQTKEYKDLAKISTPLGELLMLVFDEEVEAKLIQPTFITHYPIEVSPLARKFDDNPAFTERFELFMCGRELANAFTELNDPIDQRKRFEAQMLKKEAGDEEAQGIDEDYICALEHAMPPTGGLGVGIDRLVMFLTDSASIKDVILFPQLKRK